MTCCTLRGVITCGTILAIIDIFHGLATLGFYGYQFVKESFYLCPLELDVSKCHNKFYIYDQLYEMRVYIGIGEGAIGVLFAILYIVALMKQKPSWTWLWLLKAFGVIIVNIYYLSYWLVRRDSFDHISGGNRAEFEDHFLYFGQTLTLVQICNLVVYCAIGAMFTYKVVEEKRRSRMSLRSRRSFNSASAPPYHEEEAQYLNETLTHSEKTLPIRGSKGSLSEVSRADTFKHSTGV